MSVKNMNIATGHKVNTDGGIVLQSGYVGTSGNSTGEGIEKGLVGLWLSPVFKNIFIRINFALKKKRVSIHPF